MRVLVVCTANVARSPLAMVRLQALLGPDADVRSAGVQAREGMRAAPESVELAAARGLDLTRHRSRPVSDGLVAGADLVLTMSQRQRDLVGPKAPGAATYTFTLRELVRLAEHLDTTGAPDEPLPRLRWLAERAHPIRPAAPPAATPEDIADPIGLPSAHWQAMDATLDEVFSRLGLTLPDLTG